MASSTGLSAIETAARLTSFVGRRNDLAAVRQLFSVTRLVTLTGMGGVGKSRLALESALQMQRAFSDGVFMVELAGLRDPDLVPRTVLDALGIRHQAARDPGRAIAEHVRDRRMLIVLDNCEHMVEAVVNLADQLLRTAPDLSMLITSRHALRMQGEHIYPVPPLLVPDPDDSIKPGAAVHYPSVALFADRSAAVVPGFKVTPDNEAAVIRLSHRLEGIPLAIELASVRLRVLTVDTLADQLEDRFRVLREGNRNIPQRHQTLQSLIDWSHDLCTPSERLLWARSSVFAGTFDIEGLEAVCTDDQFLVDEVLDTVGGLLDKSIIVREEHSGHIRFRMLETIREYGRAHLVESGDEPHFARRHRDWYVELFDRAEHEWVSPRQIEWATRLQLEHANVRLALEYCLTTAGEAKVGLWLSALPWFWGAMDHPVECQLWLERGLAIEREPSRERAWGLTQRAYIGGFEGMDVAEGESLVDQAESIADQLDDEVALAFTKHVRGFLHVIGPRRRPGIPLLSDALDSYRRLGLPQQYVDTVQMEWATALVLEGESEQAAVLIDDLYERCTRAGESWNRSYALWLRGCLAVIERDLDAAEELLRESLRMKRPIRDALGFALVLEVLSWVHVERGDAELAATLMGGTDRIWQSIGSRQLARRHAAYEARGRKLIGDAQFDAHLAQGHAMTFDKTVAFGLADVPSAIEVPSPVEPPDTTTTALTRRQSEVALLVAAGLSNKEIAAKLVISLRTAEGHVEKILTKRGFTSRTQIAGWLAQTTVGQ